MSSTHKDFIDILIVGVGGQGIISLGKFFQAYAAEDPRIVKMVATESRGVSQREGSVKSIVRYLMNSNLKSLDYSPSLCSGSVSVLIAMEPLEFLRNIQYVHPESCVILNSQPLIPKSCFTKTGIKYPDIDSALIKVGQAFSNLKIIRKNYYNLALDRYGQSIMMNRLMLEDMADQHPWWLDGSHFKPFLDKFFPIF